MTAVWLKPDVALCTCVVLLDQRDLWTDGEEQAAVPEVQVILLTQGVQPRAHTPPADPTQQGGGENIWNETQQY